MGIEIETEHHQVPITAHGQHAYIDEPLIPLVMDLWAAGITTYHCCQGGYEYPDHLANIDYGYITLDLTDRVAAEAILVRRGILITLVEEYTIHHPWSSWRTPHVCFRFWPIEWSCEEISARWDQRGKRGIR